MAVLKINKKNAKYPNTQNSHTGGITHCSWKDGSFLFLLCFFLAPNLLHLSDLHSIFFFFFFSHVCSGCKWLINSAFHCHLPISWVVQMVLWQLYKFSGPKFDCQTPGQFLNKLASLLFWGRGCTDGTLIIVICWGIILTNCRLTSLGLSAINWGTYFNTQHADLVANV